ncbi:uncharacterized protein LOC133114305 isoform X1 [Conger conger]|uniref:uncharacterized protein LOC133114305 isoform X1 n=1 Tax=Conger conger TaxID=82655 RepID=UPI002A59AD83|nr:uncharacterized protein LOC133114305 isoform X1 [Conger conger]XP_061079555.1 uncharacterized protein LOC133114305 isoform X1 [Conger conger]XP_061079556.1 uncharacterized protein LOC133114305 isoform X1 [Conger conger]XP_061079557.1 uncharacterized protein LOC133114305 isoform X1 [Conger conger]
MEAEGCTVTVSGLPTDIEEDRLTDKLCIHFLRSRHGGGEVTSVNIIKTMPSCALITFEDSQVAQSVVQYGKHILLVDDKEYELTVSFPSKEVDQDKVFMCMTVTVDYNWLPMGKEALTSVQQSSPGVQCGFDLPAGLCTLSGPFSVVQAIVAQLLGFLEKPETLEKPTRQASVPDLGGFGRVSPEVPPCRTLEGSSGTSRRRGPRAEPLLQDYDQSVVVDIDTFRYLQKRCGEEYESVLRRHGVEALDVTAAGVTTLVLQARRGQTPGEGGLQEARRNLRRLCQETESRLCRERLLKDCGPREGLQQALGVLKAQLPRLLLGEDRKHISIVGSSSDVAEAKRFLLDLRAEEEERLRPRLDRAGPGTSTGKTLTTFMGGSLEGAREYSSAARLRDTQGRDRGQDRLGTRLGNTLSTSSSAFGAFPEFSSAHKQRLDINSLLGSGPVFGSGQIFGKERQGVGVGGLNLEDQRKFGSKGQDIPLEQSDPLSAASAESRSFLCSTLIDSGLPNEKLQLGSSLSSLQYMDLFGERRVQSATTPCSESNFKTTLRRSSSFSGYTRNKRDQKVGEASGSGEKLSRGNQSTPGVSREEQEAYSAEVQASTVMWEYMKEAYSARLEDIISGSQMKEGQSDGGVTTIILRGAERSSLDGCQRELKNMVAMVATDFVVQELPLARLGVGDPQDDTLEICCDEVRRRFRKVKIQKGQESLAITGPRQLCAQVAGALEEVFHDGAERRKRQRGRPPWAGGTSDTSLTVDKDNPDQSSSLAPPDGSREEPATQREEEMGPAAGERSQNAQRVSGGGGQHASQSAAQKEPIIMEKLRRGSPKDGKHSRANAAVFTHRALASTRKAVVMASTGLLSQSGPGNPPRESRGQRGQSRPGSGTSRDQD